MTDGREPTLSPARDVGGTVKPEREEWGLEVKLDGMRALVLVGRTVRMHCRHGHDHAPAFPELTALRVLRWAGGESSSIRQGGNCKVMAPATWMPTSWEQNEAEMFSCHRTAFYPTNSPKAGLAREVYNSSVEYGGGGPAARPGTYVLAVKQPTELCYWLDRAFDVAHLSLATDGNGNC
jgi:hypothetical protein